MTEWLRIVGMMSKPVVSRCLDARSKSGAQIKKKSKERTFYEVKQAGAQRDRQTDRQTDRTTDRHVDRQVGRQTDRQTDTDPKLK